MQCMAALVFTMLLESYVTLTAPSGNITNPILGNNLLISDQFVNTLSLMNQSMNPSTDNVSDNTLFPQNDSRHINQSLALFQEVIANPGQSQDINNETINPDEGINTSVPYRSTGDEKMYAPDNETYPVVNIEKTSHRNGTNEAVNCSSARLCNSSNAEEEALRVVDSKMEHQLVRSPSRLSLNGSYISAEEKDKYIEIIKGIKWGVNSVALIMTLLAIVSFIRTKNRSSSTTFIIALNIFEFIAALLSIVGYTLNYTLGGASEGYLLYTQSVNMYITAVCRRIVYLLNLLMSGQKLTVVALPFAARTTFRNKINTAIIVIIVLLTFGAHIYIPLTYVIVHRGGGVYRLSYSRLYNDYKDHFEKASVASKFVFAFLPLIVSLLANLVLLAFLKRHNKNTEVMRATNSQGQSLSRQDRQVSLMVLVSSLSFTLLCIPANTHLLVTTYTKGYGYYQKEHYLFLVVHEALLGLLTLGDITNFLTYLFLSSAFKEQLFTAFKPLCVVCRRGNTSASPYACSSNASKMCCEKNTSLSNFESSAPA